jgi:hypothetical protein
MLGVASTSLEAVVVMIEMQTTLLPLDVMARPLAARNQT